MAASQGLSKSTVSTLWKSHNLKPHRTKTFKLSRDPNFLEKLTDLVGLCLNPPGAYKASPVRNSLCAHQLHLA